MAKVDMQRLSMVALRRNKNAILDYLQNSGMLEIDIKLDKKTKKSVRYKDTSERRATLEKRGAAAEQAIGILEKYSTEKKSLLAMLEGKPSVERSEYDDVRANLSDYTAEAQAIIDLEKKISDDTSRSQRLENEREALVPWMALDVSLDTPGTDYTTVIIGTIPDSIGKEDILKALSDSKKSLKAAELEIVSQDKDMTYIALVCLKSEADAAEEALREMGFARLSGGASLAPKDEDQRLSGEIEKLKGEIDETIEKVREHEPSLVKMKMLSDYCTLTADKAQAVEMLPHTRNTFVVSGYVPKSRASQMASDLEEKFGAAVEVSEPGEKEKVPVLLKNNPFSSAWEGIVTSYGIPGKGEIDPTIFVSISYVFLFGMMLSDFAYGALVALAMGFVLIKFKNIDEGLKKSVILFFACGLSTMFWGLMFGGFFGDVITSVATNFFGAATDSAPAFPILWFEPLGNPMKLLIFSLAVGVVHMFLGLGIKGYQMLKDGDVVGFISDIVGWYAFLIGLGLMLFSTSIWWSIYGKEVHFSQPVMYLAYGLALFGLIDLLLMAGRRKKNIALRLLLGVYEIYGITSWLSDVLSYSRLLALGLATGVIAQVVNQIGALFAEMFGGAIGGVPGKIVGVIIFIAVFLIGTVFNLFINLLGSYVHTNRLQYVEFFGKFYDGSGREFRPFKAITKHVNFKYNS